MEDSAELLHIDGEGSGTECVSLVAIGTTDGAVEVATVAQGALQPLAFSSISSFKVAHPPAPACFTAALADACCRCRMSSARFAASAQRAHADVLMC